MNVTAMTTFYAGVAVQFLLSLACALLLTGVRRHLAERSWTLASQQRVVLLAEPLAETTHSAL